MKSYPKKIKKLIRDYMAEAYERELHRELSKLEVSFSRVKYLERGFYRVRDKTYKASTWQPIL